MSDKIPISSGERLAINLIDIDRLSPTIMRAVIVPHTIKKAVQVGEAVSDVGIEFSCDLLHAATICDVIRSDDRKMGDPITRIYLFNGRSWKKLPDEAILTRVDIGADQRVSTPLQGLVLSLSPKYFETPAVAPKAPTPTGPLSLGRKVGKK